MANQIVVALPRVTDANGNPVSGAKAKFYQTGTTTPITVYTDDALAIPHAWPVVADSGGRFAQVFYGGAFQPKVIVTNASDVTLWQMDPAVMIDGTASAAENITFSPVVGNAAVNVQDAIENNTTGLAGKVPVTRTISAGLGLTGGGDLSANRTISLALLDDDTFSTATSDKAASAESTKAYVDSRRSRVLLATKTAASSATLDFTEFNNAAYRRYEFEFENVKPATDSVDFYIRTSTNAGSSYDAGATDYAWGSDGTSAGTATQGASAGDVAILMSTAVKIGNAAAEYGVSGLVDVSGAPSATVFTEFRWHVTYWNTAGAMVQLSGGGARLAASDVDAARFLFSAGNITSGTIRMYGVF